VCSSFCAENHQSALTNNLVCGFDCLAALCVCFWSSVFSLSGSAAAAGPPSTGTLRTGGQSGTQTQRIDNISLVAYFCGMIRTCSLRGLAGSGLLLPCCCLVSSPSTMLQLLQTLEVSLNVIKTSINVSMRSAVLSWHHAGSAVFGSRHYSQTERWAKAFMRQIQYLLT
jgi:hypothetical protein